MKEIVKTPVMEEFLDKLSMATMNRSRSLSLAGNNCVSCGGRADTFRDEISRREYKISSLCQKCQDKVFGVVDSEE